MEGYSWSASCGILNLSIFFLLPGSRGVAAQHQAGFMLPDLSLTIARKRWSVSQKFMYSSSFPDPDHHTVSDLWSSSQIWGLVRSNSAADRDRSTFMFSPGHQICGMTKQGCHVMETSAKRAIGLRGSGSSSMEAGLVDENEKRFEGWKVALFSRIATKGRSHLGIITCSWSNA